MEAFKTKFDIPNLKLSQVGNWVISLRPRQVTLGSLILSLDRKCESFEDLTEAEGIDLTYAFKVLEGVLDRGFRPDKINYLALMMVDRQVHYHVIPRYELPIQFKGVYYKDKNWPEPPNLLEFIDFSDQDRNDLYLFLKSML